ncbi:hypothetical protein ET495_07175 [Xylanimonas allomyrinae]|uniref:Uncharacterized protein n=1 Tax=Xylanimonas allomyrinae TaxID=2509459 RepID=A0A4V0YE58_9MICO|nr:hypothetical protein ET495_07175 [Xylanimonas allomyrinae]
MCRPCPRSTRSRPPVSRPHRRTASPVRPRRPRRRTASPVRPRRPRRRTGSSRAVPRPRRPRRPTHRTPLCCASATPCVSRGPSSPATPSRGSFSSSSSPS